MSEIAYEEWVELAPGIRRVTQRNPGPFTGAGTNTHLVGRRRILILDPGVEDDTHYEAVVAAVAEAEVIGVYSSHSHPDHWPLAPRLAARFGSPTLGFASQGGYEPTRLVADREVLATDDRELRAVHTPGHASDHLCLLDAERRELFSGDHVMGWSTTIISPPDGNLNDYMRSLELLLDLEFSRAFPAHGAPIEDGPARVRELHAHRLERTEQALEALRAGIGSVPEMVERIYADTPRHLHPAATRSLWAHLDALVESGQVERTPGEPLEATYRLV